MKRHLLRFHRLRIVPAVRFCNERFGCRSVIVALAVVIGILAAFATAAMHLLMHWPIQLGQQLFADAQNGGGSSYLAFSLLPFAGLALSCLVPHLWGGPRYAKSLSPLILALSRHRNSIPLKETITHLVSSSLAVGCGGSAGLEAPSVLTGAAIGANSASLFGIERGRRNLLIGCGAAAAISAIFNSP
ncbi:MAG: chloride channel protein, partial [Lentisphaeria bacterium]|nr:chloride channel protein [Lentisphaeria bacterium]